MPVRCHHTIRPVVLCCVLAVLSAPCLLAVEGRPLEPYEQPAPEAPISHVDVLVQRGLERRGLAPAAHCSDAVFLRRVHLDLTGRLPEPKETLAFLDDSAPDKRAAVVEDLLTRPAFADYWTRKWCDLLRVKAEFPINLWPNGVQAYHRWIHDAVRRNLPYDRLARALLCSSGSNFRVPAVNFYLSVQERQPAALADAVALTFMGVRLQHWPAAQRAGLEALLSRLAFKGTAEWKEMIVHLDPAPGDAITARMPDGRSIEVAADADPRHALADWLLSPANPWFAPSVANRCWAWLMGRGIVHEPDDFRPDNPPVHPELLDYLAQELVRSGYDLQHLFRLIVASRTYQQSPLPRLPSTEAEACFAHYAPRRLDAETLIDALCWATDSQESYMSMVPEPFTFIPRDHPTGSLADGSIGSQFLTMFGRPARDTGFESERNNAISEAQRLHLINSSHVQDKIERAPRLAAIANQARRDRAGALRALYLLLLSRPPTESEAATAGAVFAQRGVAPAQAVTDLAWALINSKEFLYRH